MNTHISELILAGKTYGIITDGTVGAQEIINAITRIDHKCSITDHLDAGVLLDVCYPLRGEVLPVRRVMYYDWATGVGADGMRQRHAVMRDNEHRDVAEKFGDDTAVVYVSNGRFRDTFIRAFPASIMFVPSTTLTLCADPANPGQCILRSIRCINGAPEIHYTYRDGVLTPRHVTVNY